MQISFSFTVHPEHRSELLKLGFDIPESVTVAITPDTIPDALRADVMSQLVFDVHGRLRQPRCAEGEVPSHPAHNLRSLYLTLSREAYCVQQLKTRPRVAITAGTADQSFCYAQSEQRLHLNNATHLIKIGPLQGRFTPAELCGLAQAHSHQFAAYVDVDYRHLLLLQCEHCNELAGMYGYNQEDLLTKISALTMREGNALFNTLQRYNCNARGYAAQTHDLVGLMKELGCA